MALKRPRSLTSMEVNKLLSRAASTEDLLCLIRVHGPQFNDINTATSLHRLAKKVPYPPQEVLSSLYSYFASSLLEAGRKGGCSPRTISALCFALGTMGLSDKELLHALSVAAAASLRAADGAFYSSFLWAMGKLGWFPSETVLPFSLLSSGVAATARSMSSLEVCNSAWGAARSGLSCGQFWASLGARARELAEANAFTPQGLSIVSWSWAHCRVGDSGLGEALGRAALLPLHSGGFGALDLAQFASSLSRGGLPRLSTYPGLAQAFFSACEKILPKLEPQSAISLLAAVMAMDGPLPPMCRSLAQVAMSGISSTEASGLGCLCLAIIKRLIPSSQEASEGITTTLLERISQRVNFLVHTLPWRSVAACDLALRLLIGELGGDLGGAPLCALGVRALTTAEELERQCEDTLIAPSALFLLGLTRMKLLPPPLLRTNEMEMEAAATTNATRETTARVLLCGDDPSADLTRSIEAMGIDVTHWRRFECEGGRKEVPASAWFEPPSSTTRYSAAVIRFPSSTASFSYVLSVVLPLLSSSANIFVLGHTNEGLTPTLVTGLGQKGPKSHPLLNNVRVHASSAQGALVVHAQKCKHSGPKTFFLDEWEELIDMPSISPREEAGAVLFPSPWISYPGLFAGGGLDLMSAALISVTREQGWAHGLGGKRVLDFCCGNGAIGAALLALNPDIKLTLCDADALALHAAQKNISGLGTKKVRIKLCDGLPPRAKRAFKAIFANPPVHSAQADSLGVVVGLLRGARERLKPGGSVYIVAQGHVPVGALAQGISRAGGVKIECFSVEGGRFVVWHLEFPMP